MDYEFKIIKNIAVISKTSGWQKEINLISWNRRAPKYDFRSWNEDHTKMGKGISFTREELKTIAESLKIMEELGTDED